MIMPQARHKFLRICLLRAYKALCVTQHQCTKLDELLATITYIMNNDPFYVFLKSQLFPINLLKIYYNGKANLLLKKRNLNSPTPIFSFSFSITACTSRNSNTRCAPTSYLSSFSFSWWKKCQQFQGRLESPEEAGPVETAGPVVTAGPVETAGAGAGAPVTQGKGVAVASACSQPAPLHSE